MNEIVLSQWTSLEDILAWNLVSSETRLTVRRDASFKLFGEGAFVAALHAIRVRSSHILVHFPFDLTEAIATPQETTLWPDILSSLAGVALLQIADAITDRAGREITAELVKAIWEERVIPGSGVIGDGKKKSIICRFPGNSVPKCLRQSNSIRVPQRLQFEDLLRKLGGELGATGALSKAVFLDSRTEDELSGFLFEAFRNVLEHNGDVPDGVWGITIEKIIITNREDIRSRAQIPSLAYDYLERELGTGVGRRGGFLLNVTISDFGRGIQNTLPLIPGHDESGWQRLLRAFEKGVSRKPKSGSPDWGQGLPNILETIRHLRALLFVRSADEAALSDGSAGAREWVRVTDRVLASDSVPGTSLSALWVVRDETPDQTTFGF